MEYFGIDLHSKHSTLFGFDDVGEVTCEEQVATTRRGFEGVFGGKARCRIVVECSEQSAWAARVLEEMGHEVLVLNSRRLRLIAESTLKCDRIDAQILARLARLDDAFLRPVYQRSEGARELRTRLRVRSSLVRVRTALINSVRGSLRTHGYRMGSCTSEGFATRFGRLKLKRELRQALDPLVETIAELTARIERLERELEQEARSDELLVRLQDVPGVGPLVSLAFVAWMDRPERFARSRDVGACLGLRPKIRDSGGRQRRGSITREGDPEMRRLLVQAAHASLRCLKDSALKRWARRLELRAGKRKMAVALARKIAVLLHRLWVTGDTYRHFPATT